MKKGIHPEYHKEAKVIVDGQHVMTVGSTQPQLNVEIWAGSHPFYTGTQKFIDTASRIEKFETKKTKAQPIKVKKGNKKETSQPSLTLKDMLQALKQK